MKSTNPLKQIALGILLAGAATVANADEIQGQQIVWDSTAESFNVRGGAATASNPGGRVRAVITPRVPADEAAPAAAPAASGALKPSPGLGDRR